jgi:hypothetical protein
MTEQNEPRAGTPDTPPRAPGGEAARRDSLVRHFRTHGARYTRFALDQGARTAGYSDNDIAAAWSMIDAEDAGIVPASRFATVARIIVVALYVATFVLFVAASNMTRRSYGVGPFVLGVTLLVVGGIALLVVGRRKVVSREPLLALTSLLAVPFVLLVIVAGLCVATTNPTFFGDPNVYDPGAPPEEFPSDAPADAPADLPSDPPLGATGRAIASVGLS